MGLMGLKKRICRFCETGSVFIDPQLVSSVDFGPTVLNLAGVQIPDFQTLLSFICENGFEHHVAVNPTLVADAVCEAMDKYLEWDVYYHQG